MSDEEQEAEERAQEMARLKKAISSSLDSAGVQAYPWELENDILVHGALSQIVKVYLDWRSEIDEELG